MHTDPLGYFLTWTCYGTWLPGDDRGWTKWHRGDEVPQPLLADWCREKMTESPVLLSILEREVVHETIAQHCEIRNWRLHAVNCRSNHCHCVISAPNHSAEQARDQLKSWCTRKLKEHQQRAGVQDDDIRQHWWTRKGSVRLLFDDESLDAAIAYTLEAQDNGGSKGIQ